MPIALEEWLRVLKGDYLDGFIPSGGAAIKFAVADPPTARRVMERLPAMAAGAKCAFATVSGATTRLHLTNQLFHAVAAQIDWGGLARFFLEERLRAAGSSGAASSSRR
jgi:sugar (pentulose or hexulose) kinase